VIQVVLGTCQRYAFRAPKLGDCLKTLRRRHALCYPPSMRPHILTLFLATSLCATPFLTAKTPTVDSRLATQNALFEEIYQADLKNFPERATAFGDYRYNDQLSDHSLSAVARRRTEDTANLARLSAIPTTGFPEQDILSHDLLARVLQQRLADYDLKEYEMPVDQMNGVHTALADLPLSMPFDSIRHYEAYIARLHQIPRVLNQTAEVLRAGLKDNLMPVRFLLEKVPVQCNGIIEADPFLIPTKKFPTSISLEDQKRLTAEITAAVNTDVLPAYRTFATFITTDCAPHGRTTIAVTSLPNGARRYQNDILARTTTTLTPDQIHTLGLNEVARITAEMTALANKAGFADLAAFRTSINSNPKWTPTSAEQILDDYRRYIAQMQPRLPDLFTVTPAALSPSKPSPPSSPPTPPITRAARPTANALAASSSPPATSATAPCSSMRPSRTTRAFQAITCRSPSSNSSRACLASPMHTTGAPC